ncbi:MAG: CDP-alcohol phosphatidyltransferase family protein [Planctomycetota bacterium]|jgi:phosphatidylglycerophosphate synthase
MTDFNYFAEHEQAGQKRFQRIRDGLLSPVIRLLIACRISANVVSAVSILMLAPAGWMLLRSLPASPPAGDALVAALLVWLHVILDAFDGPLARHVGSDGQAGAFTDMCVDHSGMLITSCLLSAAGLIDGTLAAVYVSSYTVAVVFTVWLNVLGRPFPLVIRTKYLLYLLLTFFGFTGTNWLPVAVTAFCGIHIVFAVWGFFRVHATLAKRG